MSIINISLPDEMAHQVKKEAKSLGISFSDYIKLLISKQFNGFSFEATPNNKEHKE